MAAIVEIHARRVWDSRGRPTVEAEVALEDGTLGRAIAPAGASTGSGEARDKRDGGKSLRGLDVRHAVQSVNGEIRAALLGRDAAAQRDIDNAMIALDGTPDKHRLGGNALVAVSLPACRPPQRLRGCRCGATLRREARCAAGAANPDLWRRARARTRSTSGLHGGLPGAGSFAESLEWTAEVYYAAARASRKRARFGGVADEGGYWPSFKSNEEGVAELVAR